MKKKRSLVQLALLSHFSTALPKPETPISLGTRSVTNCAGTYDISVLKYITLLYYIIYAMRRKIFLFAKKNCYESVIMNIYP